MNAAPLGEGELGGVTTTSCVAVPGVPVAVKLTLANPDTEAVSVGRDGASDAVSFLRVGVPAVEFGPVGAGHHGPEEWVSISSLQAYRQALEAFLRSIPGRLDD